MIYLCSYPRSGNTMMREAFHHCFGIGSKSINSNDVIPDMGGEDLGIQKTHENPKNLNGQIIYIVRDGRDCLLSLAYFRKDFFEKDHHRPINDLLMELIEVGNGQDGLWCDHVLSAAGLGIKLSYFEDLVQWPRPTAMYALRRVGIKSESFSEMPDFWTFKSKNPAFFRHGKVGGWRSEFSDDMLRMFWKVHGEAMKAVYPGVEP